MFCFDPPRWTLRKIDSDMQDKLKSEGVARLGDSIDDSDRGSPMCRTIRSRENGGATNRELRCPRYIQHRTPTPNCYTTSPGSKIHLPGRTIKKNRKEECENKAWLVTCVTFQVQQQAMIPTYRVLRRPSTNLFSDPVQSLHHGTHIVPQEVSGADSSTQDPFGHYHPDGNCQHHVLRDFPRIRLVRMYIHN